MDAYHSRHGITTRRERDYKVCQRTGCDNDIPENFRADARYCSNSCRQKIYNQAHKADAKEKRDKIKATQRQRQVKVQEKKAVDEFIKELMGE